MSSLIEAFAWCIVQVTLFSSAAGCVYGLARSDRHGGRGPLLLVSLLTVGGLTLLTVSPWPQWGVSAVTLQPALFPAVDVDVDSLAEASGMSPTSAATQPAARDSDSRVSSHPVDPLTSASSQHEPAMGTSSLDSQWLHYVVWAAWAAAMIGVGRLLIGVQYVRRCRRESTPIADDDLSQLLAALRGELGIRHLVDVLETARLAVPATVGWRRPAVLLPDTWRSWTPDQRRAVLAHELAHVRQRHFPAWLMSQLAVVGHYYHPLVHWLSRRLRMELEMSADALAATLFSDRRQYAAALAGLALGPSRNSAPIAPLGLFMSRPLLMRRIAMLRQTNEPVRRSSRWKIVLAFVVLAVVAVGVAGLRAAADGEFPLPPPFDPAKTTRAIALLRASREVESMATGQSQTMSDAAWKTYCSSQVAVIKSDWLLHQALSDPVVAGLPILGSPQQAPGWLQRNLRVGFIGDSEIMYVLAYSAPAEAAEVKQIVDAVVKAYLQDARFRDVQRKEVPITALTRSLEGLNADIARKMEDYINMAKELGSAKADGSEQWISDLLIKQVQQIDTELMRLEGEFMQLASAGKEFNHEFYQNRMKQLAETKEQRMAEIQKRLKRSVDLEIEARELEQLQRIADDMRKRLEALEVDRDWPLRIEQIHPAIATSAGDSPDFDAGK